MPEKSNNAADRQKKIEAFLLDPEKTIFETITEFEGAVTSLTQILSGVDLESLEKIQGQDGYTPERGVDYFTPEDIQGLQDFILSKIPKVGADLPSVQQVEDFVRNEVAKIPRIKGDKGDSVKGEDGKDGSPDTGVDIIKKLRALGKNQMLKIDDIRGLENVLKKLVNEEDFAALEKRVDEFKIVIPANPGGGGNDAAAIHSDGVDEFAPITEDLTPAAGDYFIAERASDGSKIKVPFSAIGNGTDGRTVLNGSGVPSNGTGADGDFYINTANYDIYLKTGGAWGSPTSLVGADGTDGTDGADGNTILYGTAAPTTEGVDGDFYIRTTTKFIYGPKAAGTWPAGTSLVGPAGAGSGDMLAATYDPTSKAADAFDMANMVESATKKILTSAERTKLGFITVTQAVDLDAIETNSNASKTKTDFITVTQAVDLDTMETQAAAGAAAKVKTDFITITQAVDLDAIETNSNASKVKTDYLTVTAATDLDSIRARVLDLDAAVILRGSWDASAGTFPGGGTAQAGASYIVSVAGTVNSVAFAVGDRVIAITDNASTTTFASNWFKADYTDQVLSVAGKTGAVTLDAADITETAGLKIMTSAERTKVAALSGTNTGDETTTTAGALINGATGKTTPVDADYMGIMDSAASNILKKVSWANIKATLKTYFDTLYLALAGGTMTGTLILAENASVQLDPAGSADGKFTGITVTGVSDYSQAFGDLVYLKAANSRWAAADADALATAGNVMLAMVVVTGTSGNACTLLLQGIIRADAKFPAMTIGATQYVGEAAGEVQGAIPTGADNIIRTVGYALTADELYFNPSTDWQVTVA